VIQQLEFVCNPFVRDVVCLAAMNMITKCDSEWVCQYNGADVPLQNVLSDILDTQRQQSLANPSTTENIIQLAKNIHIIQMVPGESNIELDDDFGKQLRSGDLGIFELFKSRKNGLRNRLREVIPHA